jgi:hypothetical protein
MKEDGNAIRTNGERAYDRLNTIYNIVCNATARSRPVHARSRPGSAGIVVPVG